MSGTKFIINLGKDWRKKELKIQNKYFQDPTYGDKIWCKLEAYSLTPIHSRQCHLM